MNYKLTTLITCTGGSMVTMMLILGALEPQVDSARMMAIAILCGLGSSVANLMFQKRRYPAASDSLQSLLRQGKLSPAQQFTIMDAIAILDERSKA
ncbi:hypothetical protein NG799_21840 [Laspinema sp. D1]|uniref:Uncharacterized protein n=1 Tax=Laspinema palackyanum D2a TaxID=2953684 RepID=A0ABT2MWS4_9CYAN|nr:hypothetical protein [Laspinema sp. D2a]